MSEESGAKRRIGAVAFHPESGEVAGPSGTVRLAPQPASLLTLLASLQGAVVSRDAIRRHLWPGGKVEFDQGIAFAVREVRKGIEAAGGDPTLVETIPRRGLRLNADGHAAPPRDRRPRYLVPAISGLLALAAVLLAPRLLPPEPPVVALFAHDARGVETAAAVSAPLGAALTTALTASLRDVAGIVGPTGTAAISGPDDTEGARSSLGACLVVSGAVQATGTDSVIVFTQIVRTTDRVHVWARLDTVSVSNAVAAIVPGVARGVVAALPGC